MARILRGDIYWADLNPVRGQEQAGRRPVLVLSEDVFNQHSGTAIVVAVTSRPQRAGYPLTLELTGTRLPRRSWAKISQIRTISTLRLTGRIGQAQPDEVEQVAEGVKELIGA